MKIALIIQGPKLVPELCNHHAKYNKYFDKIVYCTHEDTNWGPFENIKIDKEFKKNKAYNYGNIFLQCITTLKGIYHLGFEYDYIVKTRTDEYYENWDEFQNTMTDQDSDHKITTNNVFFNASQWHISDHVIGASFWNLKGMFETIYERCLSDEFKSYVPGVRESGWMPTESLLAESYLKYKTCFEFGPAHWKKQMYLYFNLVRVSTFGKFLAVTNNNRKEYHSEEELIAEGSMINFDQL